MKIADPLYGKISYEYINRDFRYVATFNNKITQRAPLRRGPNGEKKKELSTVGFGMNCLILTTKPLSFDTYWKEAEIVSLCQNSGAN